MPIDLNTSDSLWIGYIKQFVTYSYIGKFVNFIFCSDGVLP